MPPDDARHRPGHEEVHRTCDGGVRSRDAARRRHQVEVRPHVEPLELLAEPRHVAGHLRADVRVQAHGREALVLAVLRQHLRRDREERLGELLADDLGHARLVRGVDEREEEADRHRLDAGLLERPDLRASLLLVQRHEHGAVLDDPLGHRQPVAPPHDRVALPRQILVVREVERLLVPRDVEDVPVALGGEHAPPGHRCARSRCWSRSSSRGRPDRAPRVTSRPGRRPRAMPCTVPCDGSAGVVGSLWTRILPASSST